MSTTTSSISGLFKRIYDTYVESMQNLESRTIDEIGNSLQKYNAGGEGFFGAINDSGNEAGGAQNESENFRTIDSESYQQYKVSPKVIAWPIQFTGLSAAAADSDEEAFASSIVDALDRSKDRLMSDENRQFFGSGTGTLGSPAQAVLAAATSMTVQNTQYLRRNQVVDIFTGATKTVDSIRIADVDHQNKVVTFTGALGADLATTDEIVKENIRDSAPTDGKEMMGLRGIVDDGTDVQTFQNIDTASNDIWKSIRIDTGGANLTSDLIQRLLDDVAILGGDEPDTMICHHKQRRKYLDLVVPQKRYMDGKMDTGHTALSFNGKRFLLDKDCQTDTLYAVKKEKLRRFEVKSLQLGNYDGSDKFLRVANQDVFQAYWVHYANFGTSKRNCHGKLANLGTPNGVS